MKLAFKQQLSHLSLNVIAFVVAILIAATAILIFSSTFDINPFNQRTSELLIWSFCSLIGMAGASLMLNIASNLSIIAEKKGDETQGNSILKTLKYWIGGVVCAIVIGIGGLMLAGSNSDEKTFNLVKRLAEEVLNEQHELLNSMALSLKTRSHEDLVKIVGTIEFLETQRTDLPSLTLIYPGSFNGKDALFQLGRYAHSATDANWKPDYYPCRKGLDCEYLKAFFATGEIKEKVYTRKNDKDFSLYFPFEIQVQRFVLLFSRWFSYGKYGS